MTTAQDKETTVGELIRELQKHDERLPVRVTCKIVAALQVTNIKLIEYNGGRFVLVELTHE